MIMLYPHILQKFTCVLKVVTGLLNKNRVVLNIINRCNKSNKTGRVNSNIQGKFCIVPGSYKLYLKKKTFFMLLEVK